MFFLDVIAPAEPVLETAIPIIAVAAVIVIVILIFRKKKNK